jgi:hypothetical protein
VKLHTIKKKCVGSRKGDERFFCCDETYCTIAIFVSIYGKIRELRRLEDGAIAQMKLGKKSFRVDGDCCKL